MAIKSIDAKLLQKMFLSAAARLSANKEWINELNVFPVPDGDTGTNMTMTIMSAAKDVVQISDPDMENLSKAISMGALKGARGNSGVILSQLFRGFTREIKDRDSIDVRVAAQAFMRACETAYKAVMKPKEGTILTVARGMSEKAVEVALKTDDLEKSFKMVIDYGDYVLSKTPEMLPVLKQAGVVDSGGQGLMEVVKGAFDAMVGKEVDYSEFAGGKSEGQAKPSGVYADNIDTSDIKFGYCTEFIIMLEKRFNDNDERKFKAFLESIGDSIVCVSLDDIVKIHVHTNDPGLAIQKALTYGQLTKMKIDNMREEHNERLFAEQQKKEEGKDQTSETNEPQGEKKAAGFIAVSIGEGVNNIFKELGTDYIIEGGQTMNPSTEDMLAAISAVNADTIFILPNNSNIIMTANQARDLTEDKEVIVVPSKTIPQGICAIINYIDGASGSENMDTMVEAIKGIKTGQVTYAIRDTSIDDKEIHKGNIMGIGDDKILSVGENIEETTIGLIDEMVDEESALISIYYGADISREDAEALREKVEAKYPDCEIELEMGGQPVYYYLLSVE